MKIPEKIDAWFKKATEKAVPVVKKEFEKVVKRSTVNVKDNVFYILTGVAILYGVIDTKKAKEIVGVTSKKDELVRTVNYIYNDVHINNYYGKDA